MPERAPEVEQVVRDWLDAKQAGDGAAIRAALSTYDGALAIGTEVAEWCSSAEAFAEAHAAGAPFTAVLDHLEAHREVGSRGLPFARSFSQASRAGCRFG